MEEKVLDTAKALAEEILASQTWLDYTEKKRELVASGLLTPMMLYDQAKLVCKSGDQRLLADAQKIISEYQDTMAGQKVQQYRQAESRLNALIANINHTILHFLGDEYRKGCGGNCASCSGCSK